jgi:hypothetical protein
MDDITGVPSAPITPTIAQIQIKRQVFPEDLEGSKHVGRHLEAITNMRWFYGGKPMLIQYAGQFMKWNLRKSHSGNNLRFKSHHEEIGSGG